MSTCFFLMAVDTLESAEAEVETRARLENRRLGDEAT